MYKDITLDEFLDECSQYPNKRKLNDILKKIADGIAVRYSFFYKKLENIYVYHKTYVSDLPSNVRFISGKSRVRIYLNNNCLHTKFYLYYKIAVFKKSYIDTNCAKSIISMIDESLDIIKEFDIKGICDVDYDDNEYMAYYIYKELHAEENNS